MILFYSRKICPILVGCKRRNIHVVDVRDEANAVFAADAYAALRQTPACVFVSRAPGATNAAIGVHSAMQASRPLVLFIANIPRPLKQREAFQEIDFAAMFSPIAKWAARIDDAERIPEYVARAYATAMAGRPGPVVLALPEDMLRDEVEAIDRPLVQPPTQPLCAEAMMALVDLLNDATDPVCIKSPHHARMRALAEDFAGQSDADLTWRVMEKTPG